MYPIHCNTHSNTTDMIMYLHIARLITFRIVRKDKRGVQLVNMRIINEFFLFSAAIYHNQLTDQFFRTILRLMSEPPNKTMYVALEKRYV